MSRLFSYSIQGATLTLRVDPPALFRAAECLHSSSRVDIRESSHEADADIVWSFSSDEREFQLWTRGQSQPEIASEAALYFLSEHRLTQLFATRLDHFLQIHAATVVDPQGDAWLISGPSRAGKTSLTLAFLLSGWHWLSDEYALFQEDDPHTVYGFPRNFNLKDSSFSNFPETEGAPHSIEYFSVGRGLKVRFLDPLDLSPGSWRSKARLKGVILPGWRPGLGTPIIKRAHGIAVAQKLLGEIANWTSWALPVVTQACRELPIFEFGYSNPRDIALLRDHIRDLPL